MDSNSNNGNDKESSQNRYISCWIWKSSGWLKKKWKRRWAVLDLTTNTMCLYLDPQSLNKTLTVIDIAQMFKVELQEEPKFSFNIYLYNEIRSFYAENENDLRTLMQIFSTMLKKLLKFNSIREGIMFKRSPYDRWQTRYFALCPRYLLYFKTKEEFDRFKNASSQFNHSFQAMMQLMKNFRGAISLDENVSLGWVGGIEIEEDKKYYCFSLTCPKKTYFIGNDDIDYVRNWVDAIQEEQEADNHKPDLGQQIKFRPAKEKKETKPENISEPKPENISEPKPENISETKPESERDHSDSIIPPPPPEEHRPSFIAKESQESDDNKSERFVHHYNKYTSKGHSRAFRCLASVREEEKKLLDKSRPSFVPIYESDSDFEDDKEDEDNIITRKNRGLSTAAEDFIKNLTSEPEITENINNIEKDIEKTTIDNKQTQPVSISGSKYLISLVVEQAINLPQGPLYMPYFYCRSQFGYKNIIKDVKTSILPYSSDPIIGSSLQLFATEYQPDYLNIDIVNIHGRIEKTICWNNILLESYWDRPTCELYLDMKNTSGDTEPSPSYHVRGRSKAITYDINTQPVSLRIQLKCYTRQPQGNIDTVNNIIEEKLDNNKLSQMFEEVACRGTIFIKHCHNRDISHERTLLIDFQRDLLDWETGYICLDDIIMVVRGRQTPTMKKIDDKISDVLLFSVITQKRSLDLQATCEEDANIWVEGLKNFLKMDK